MSHPCVELFCVSSLVHPLGTGMSSQGGGGLSGGEPIKRPPVASKDPPYVDHVHTLGRAGLAVSLSWAPLCLCDKLITSLPPKKTSAVEADGCQRFGLFRLFLSFPECSEVKAISDWANGFHFVVRIADLPVRLVPKPGQDGLTLTFSALKTTSSMSCGEKRHCSSVKIRQKHSATL